MFSGCQWFPTSSWKIYFSLSVSCSCGAQGKQKIPLIYLNMSLMFPCLTISLVIGCIYSFIFYLQLPFIYIFFDFLNFLVFFFFCRLSLFNTSNISSPYSKKILMHLVCSSADFYLLLSLILELWLFFWLLIFSFDIKLLYDELKLSSFHHAGQLESPFFIIFASILV